jgi:hypothetical protein
MNTQIDDIGQRDRAECYFETLVDNGLLERILEKFGQPAVLPDPAMDHDLELVADRAQKYVVAFRDAVVELSPRVPDIFETGGNHPENCLR